MPRRRVSILAIASNLLLAGCGGLPTQPGRAITQADTDARNEVALFALGLIDTGYRFGGKNPDAGLDCSGMVSYVFAKAAGLRLSGSAADIAKEGRPVDPAELKPGDLVFFNTLHRPYSHVGIYIGNGRFVHAPSSNGRVRTDHLDSGWFASRFEAARSYLN
jgi:cell wall-associated NlpC family hydrolase